MAICIRDWLRTKLGPCSARVRSHDGDSLDHVPISNCSIKIISARERTRNASITCASAVTHLPTVLIFGKRGRQKDGRPEDACRNLSFIIMGDTITLPVVPPHLPADWKQPPSQGSSISREWPWRRLVPYLIIYLCYSICRAQTHSRWACIFGPCTESRARSFFRRT